ncbi:MAG: tRNA lysidine(34) synthetase TilS [Methyloglobulus sp.]|nr:tRNA lysidine(34) synthetase TilS [Methyloglobulus sp.]
MLSPQLLEFKLTQIPYSRLFIAYSGGIDSHVLLHLCASIDHFKGKITAFYVNHGLQTDAEGWGLHCEQVCNNLGVKFLSLKANAKAAPGESPEEAARNARYAALKPLLAKDDLLLLAQHSEDQLETVLLQLFRGSGLKGLSGMPPSMAFGQGKLVRPLLDVSKNEILDYAKTHGLNWIEDPSNRQTHFDRNFLRNDIIPLLKQRWPSLELTVSRSAKHCANAQSLIEPVADAWLDAVFDKNEGSLQINGLQSYTPLQQAVIIRQWLKRLNLKMPSEAAVERILNEIVVARPDANPVVSTQKHSITRYRNKLYCLRPTKAVEEKSFIWSPELETIKISGDEMYAIQPSTNGISIACWQQANITVRFRQGGEQIALPNRAGRHSLKNLFQEVGIPPWERPRIPLIYLDDILAAVGDRWISAAYFNVGNVPCCRIVRHSNLSSS